MAEMLCCRRLTDHVDDFFAAVEDVSVIDSRIDVLPLAILADDLIAIGSRCLTPEIRSACKGVVVERVLLIVVEGWYGLPINT